MLATSEKNPARYPRRNVAEDRAWRRLYRDAADPVVAAEIVRHLDDDAKRLHLALYLRCRRTLRKQAARRLGQSHVASLLKRLVRGLFVHAFGRESRIDSEALQCAVDAARKNTPSSAAVDDPPSRILTPSDLTSRGLRVIETAAERANVVQLRSYLSCVRLHRLSLEGDDRASAEALILKLERLLDDQRVEPMRARPVSGDAPAPAIVSAAERPRCPARRHAA